ncbi:MAG: hypothetical protein WEC15_01295 [Flavobacteriales bacterium]
MILASKNKLKRLHKLCLDSRYALERASSQVDVQLLGDLMFMISCRRVIMLNELGRALGQLHVATKPGPDIDRHFDCYPATMPGSLGYMEVCEAEELYLVRELEDIKRDPELLGPTRAIVSNLLRETRANLKEIVYLRLNHAAFQA